MAPDPTREYCQKSLSQATAQACDGMLTVVMSGTGPPDPFCIWPYQGISTPASEIVSLVRDIVVTLAAVVTGTVAVLGLKSWSQELKGKAEFDAARSLIRSTYLLRDKFHESRSPFVSGAEFPEGYSGGDPTNTPQREGQAWVHVLNNRFAPVFDALREFEAHALEAESLWGQSVPEPVDALRHCVRELQVAMEAVVEDKLQRGGNVSSDPDFARRMRVAIFASRKEKDNDLSNRLSGAIAALETITQPHLSR